MRFGLTLDAFEQIHNPDAERLRNQVQAGKRDVHSPIFECTYLSPMESGEVCKFILRPAP